MIKARIKADDEQQKEEFQATSKKTKWNKTKNGKQEPLLTLSSRERDREKEREQSNKKEDIRFSRITSRGYKDTPELRLDYNFRWLRGSWGIVKVLETKGRKRRDWRGQRKRERRETKFRRHSARGKNEEEEGSFIVQFLSLSLSPLLGGFKGTKKRDARCMEEVTMEEGGNLWAITRLMAARESN